MMLIFAALLPTAHAQSLLNGDFETNYVSTCSYNLSNADFNDAIPGVVGFGELEDLDLHTHDCYVDPYSGDWCVGISSNDSDRVDAISLALDSPLTGGETYLLTFYDYLNQSFSELSVDLEVGASTSETDFGFPIGRTSPEASAWTRRELSFSAPSASTHITLRPLTNTNSEWTWIQVDAFEICEAGSWYADTDGDGYGAQDDSLAACSGPGAGYVDNAGDCDDGDAAVSPESPELDDERDNDCDGVIDEGLSPDTGEGTDPGDTNPNEDTNSSDTASNDDPDDGPEDKGRFNCSSVSATPGFWLVVLAPWIASIRRNRID